MRDEVKTSVFISSLIPHPLPVVSVRAGLDGWRRWRVITGARAVPDLAEDEQVEEVHHAEHDEDEADFPRERLDACGRALYVVAELEREADVAQVDEVEAYDQQVIDGVCQLLVAAEDIYQEDAPVLVQGPRDPDRERDADGKVGQIGDGCRVHNPSSVSDFKAPPSR